MKYLSLMMEPVLPCSAERVLYPSEHSQRLEPYQGNNHHNHKQHTTCTHSPSLRKTISRTLFYSVSFVALLLAPSISALTVFPSVADVYPETSGDGPFDFDLPIQVTIAVIDPPSAIYSFSLLKILPVFDKAIPVLNELYKGRIEFQYAWGIGSCDRDVVGVEAARLSCTHNISVFIGPVSPQPIRQRKIPSWSGRCWVTVQAELMLNSGGLCVAVP
ncbi:hypothetical protein PoB_006415700 [Plakobranchus ocellatus]|uniref:Receptor ligand binding region domain-containing protein n=1 Tax=Plakobranchus ocellatus TaxID=259542 RepID=A0AAV4D0E4_9GAST|nr:hypothetical protein PoB_006415700 [Plakobranchus ocellatus]